MKQIILTSLLGLSLALGASIRPGLEGAPQPPVGTLETLILFDQAAGETPESIVFDRSDNAYISLAFRGEIRKVAPGYTQATPLAFLPIRICDPSIPAVTLGLAIDRPDRPRRCGPRCLSPRAATRARSRFLAAFDPA